MPIDWFTVAAQAVNFLILVGLLKHFLYGPIVRAMDEREERVAGRLAEADEKREKAEEERERLHEERSELEDRRQEILEEAKKEGERLRRERLEEAREAANERESQWHRELERKRDEIVEELVGRMNDQLVRALEKAFAELTDSDLHANAVRVFVDRLGDLDEEQREALRSAVEERSVTIRTARDLSDEQRQRITSAIEGLGVEDRQIDFETDEELVCGLELRAGGRGVSWSLRRFADQVDATLREALAERPEGDGTAEPREAQKAGDGR